MPEPKCGVTASLPLELYKWFRERSVRLFNGNNSAALRALLQAEFDREKAGGKA